MLNGIPLEGVVPQHVPLGRAPAIPSLKDGHTVGLLVAIISRYGVHQVSQSPSAHPGACCGANGVFVGRQDLLPKGWFVWRMLLLWRMVVIGTNRYLLLLLPQRSRRRRKHPIVLWCLVDHVHIIRTVYNRLVEDQLVYGVIDGIERSSDRDSSAVPSRRDVPTFPMFSIVQEARVGGLEGSRARSRLEGSREPAAGQA